MGEYNCSSLPFAEDSDVLLTNCIKYIESAEPQVF